MILESRVGSCAKDVNYKNEGDCDMYTVNDENLINIAKTKLQRDGVKIPVVLDINFYNYRKCTIELYKLSENKADFDIYSRDRNDRLNAAKNLGLIENLVDELKDPKYKQGDEIFD